jgi:hypothetical protein
VAVPARRGPRFPPKKVVQPLPTRAPRVKGVRAKRERMRLPALDDSSVVCVRCRATARAILKPTKTATVTYESISVLGDRDAISARHSQLACCDKINRKNARRLIMKTILSALLALSVLTGVAASAYAFDAKTFYEEQDRESH